MNPSPLAIVLMGDSTRSEFADVLREFHELREIHAPTSFREFATLAIWNEQFAGEPADLIVVLQSQPDEFSGADVWKLLATNPVCRVVCIAGAWCESEGRTRDTWPVALRVPLDRAGLRLRQEFGILSGDGVAFPRTAGRDEIFELDQPP